MRHGPDWGKFIDDVSTTDEEKSSSNEQSDSSNSDNPAFCGASVEAHTQAQRPVVKREDGDREDAIDEVDNLQAVLRRSRLDAMERLGSDGVGNLALTDTVLAAQHAQDLEGIDDWQIPESDCWGTDPQKDFMTFLDREKSNGKC